MSDNNEVKTKKVGEISWTEPLGSGKKRVDFKDLYLNLANGSNMVRVITQPYQFYVHKYKPSEDTKGYGFRIGCTTDPKTCPVCKLENKPNRKWAIGVIDRKTNTTKILEITWMIFKSLQTYADDSEWGPPIKYDVNIIKDPTTPSQFYSVVPKPAKPLSASDQQLIDAFDFSELERKCQPVAVEKVQERLNKILADANISSPVASDSNDDEEAGEFKNYDNQEVPF
jgi:hypothetical protein